MIKLAAFSVSELEKPYFAKAIEKYDVEFVILSEREITLEEATKIPTGIDGVLVLPKEKTTKEIIEVLHEKGIKSLATRSAGLDAIDLDAAEAVGMRVTNVAAYSPQAIAEFAVMLILNSLRRMHELSLNMNSGNFEGIPFISHQLDSRTIGIIGYGYIGQCVAKLLQAFGAKLVVYTVENIPQDLILSNMEIEKDFTNFLKKVNVITIHCPFVPETYHLIDAEAIAKMSSEMIIVNTARGPIVDAEAVVEALNNGKISFYATDVYEFETGIFHHRFEDIEDIKDATFKRMLENSRISITPHIAFNTYTSVQNMVYYSIENSLKALM